MKGAAMASGSEELHVRVIAHVVPVSAEQLIDAGAPVPPGYIAPDVVKAPLLRRLRWRTVAAVWAARRRVGFWIAGEAPDDWEE